MPLVPEMKAPKMLEGLKPVKAEEGATAAFQCKVAGAIENVTWLKDGESLIT